MHVTNDLELRLVASVPGTVVLGWSMDTQRDEGYECCSADMTYKTQHVDKSIKSNADESFVSQAANSSQQNKKIKRKVSFRTKLAPWKRHFFFDAREDSPEAKRTDMEIRDEIYTTRDNQSILPSLVHIDFEQNNPTLLRDEHVPSVECVLPTVLAVDQCNDDCSSHSDTGVVRLPQCLWHLSYNVPPNNYPLQERDSTATPQKDDDPWAAAKRGDLAALQRFAADKDMDWTAQDEFDGTPLYYACHSGAAVGGIESVRFLLNAWPESEVPSDLLDRCKKNAINQEVLNLLRNPQHVPKSAPSTCETDDDSDGGNDGLFLLFNDDAVDY